MSRGWEVKVPIREVKARTSPAPCRRKRAARPVIDEGVKDTGMEIWKMREI